MIYFPRWEGPVMAPEHWKRIKELFDSTLDVPSAERSAFLERTCGDDPALKNEVGRLLEEFDRAGKPVVSLSEGELVADRYRITRMIGRGGMGEVYEAQDQLLGEKVALKTLRADLSRNDAYVRRFQK